MKTMDAEVVPVLQKKYPGKEICFIACKQHEGDPMHVLGIVVKDEPGYSPVSHQLAHGTKEEMDRNAKHLNDHALKLTEMQVIHFVASSMVGTRSRSRRE